jgi:antitoxin (DNA-binding transcriptional repressor) of toxin-antitoxin stability system
MATISVSQLKTHLCGELKKVKRGSPLVIVDHKQPVAMLSAIEAEPLFVKEASAAYVYEELPPLTASDSLAQLAEERADRW